MDLVPPAVDLPWHPFVLLAVITVYVLHVTYLHVSHKRSIELLKKQFERRLCAADVKIYHTLNYKLDSLCAMIKASTSQIDPELQQNIYLIITGLVSFIHIPEDVPCRLALDYSEDYLENALTSIIMYAIQLLPKATKSDEACQTIVAAILPELRTLYTDNSTNTVSQILLDIKSSNKRNKALSSACGDTGGTDADSDADNVRDQDITRRTKVNNTAACAEALPVGAMIQTHRSLHTGTADCVETNPNKASGDEARIDMPREASEQVCDRGILAKPATVTSHTNTLIKEYDTRGIQASPVMMDESCMVRQMHKGCESQQPQLLDADLLGGRHGKTTVSAEKFRPAFKFDYTENWEMALAVCSRGDETKSQVADAMVQVDQERPVVRREQVHQTVQTERREKRGQRLARRFRQLLCLGDQRR